MTTALFPTWTMPTTTTQTATTRAPVAYPPGPAFDFLKQDFVLDGTGRVVMLTGPQAWAQWCAKAVLVERFTYPIYTGNYGTDLVDVRTAPDPSHAMSDFETAASAALLADPRTRSVDTFTWSGSGDSVQVTISLTPTVGSPTTIVVPLAF